MWNVALAWQTAAKNNPLNRPLIRILETPRISLCNEPNLSIRRITEQHREGRGLSWSQASTTSRNKIVRTLRGGTRGANRGNSRREIGQNDGERARDRIGARVGDGDGAAVLLREAIEDECRRGHAHARGDIHRSGTRRRGEQDGLAIFEHRRVAAPLEAKAGRDRVGRRDAYRGARAQVDARVARI